MRSNRPLRKTVALLVLCPLLFSVLGAKKVGDCDARVRATLEGRNKEGDRTKVEFSVEVTSETNCADVVYDVVVEQRTPDNLIHRVRIPRQARLSQGRFSEVVKHEVAPGHAYLSHKAKVVECWRCRNEP